MSYPHFCHMSTIYFKVSFTDGAALIEAGAAPRLAELLFEGELLYLPMALTAALNLLSSATAAAEPSVSAQMIQAGLAHALVPLLAHADAEVLSRAVALAAAMATDGALAAALAEASAAPPLVALVAGAADGAAPATLGLGAARALLPVLEGAAAGAAGAPQLARQQARDAGGVDALSRALLAAAGGGDAESRLLLTCALGTLLDGEWHLAYEAAGWPVLLAVLEMGGASESAQQRAYLEAAAAAARLIVQPLPRQALATDAAPLHFVSTLLLDLAREGGGGGGTPGGGGGTPGGGGGTPGGGGRPPGGGGGGGSGGWRRI